MDFKTGNELLALCAEQNCSIAEVMIQREILGMETTREAIEERLRRALQIMQESAHTPLHTPQKSTGGLIGGESKRLQEHAAAGRSIAGSVLTPAILYATAVLETNASMGLIVAAPTAGSSGVLPGTLLAFQESFNLTDEALLPALLTASAIGYLATRNATVAGAVGGCQAEVGVASAMSAAAAVQLMDGTPRQCLDAAAMAIQNLLGLVCDPIAGLVEAPCQSRNAIGTANAITCAEIVLSGTPSVIPLDEMLDAMMTVGRRLPPELRETALGGCAVTPTGCSIACALSHGCPNS